MEYSQELIPGRLIRRYKRFLADVELNDGTRVTAHCTNSGSMKTVLEEGAPVYLSPVTDPKRKTRYTWEMIKINDQWVGINTNIPNQLAVYLLKGPGIPGLEGYDYLSKEVTIHNSRIDVLAVKNGERCFMEVKNVTMKDKDYALFPDAITTRGKKHLETLMQIRESGIRAVMLYVIQRMDVNKFDVAREIDPQYAETLTQAIEKGVEVIPLQVKVNPSGVSLHKRLGFEPR